MYKKFLWIGLAVILVFSPIARGAVRPWSITPVLLIEYFLIFLWALRAINVKPTTQRHNDTMTQRLTIPIAIFMILASSSFAFSIYKHDSFYALLRLFGYIGIFYVVLNEFDHRMRKAIIYLIISVGTGLSIYGLLQYFNIFSRLWWYPPDFLASTYVNHNHFAGYLELVMPVSIALLMTYPRSPNPEPRTPILYRLSLIIASTVMIAALILSESRGAWVSLGISLLVMAVIIAKNEANDKRRLLILPFFILSIFASIYFGKDVISQRVESVTDMESMDASFETRLKIWHGTIDMIRNNPLIGTGIGTFIWGFPRYRPEGLHVRANFAHNEYLNTAAEMGILASLIMIWVLFILIKTGLAAGKNSPIALGSAIGILSLSLHGFVDFNFHIPANMLLFTVYAAMIIKENSRHPHD